MLNLTTLPVVVAVLFKDQNGNPMPPIPGGAATFDDTIVGVTLAEDGSSLTVTPLKPGSTDLTLTVDGIASAALSITVAEPVVVPVLTSIELVPPTDPAPVEQPTGGQ